MYLFLWGGEKRNQQSRARYVIKMREESLTNRGVVSEDHMGQKRFLLGGDADLDGFEGGLDDEGAPALAHRLLIDLLLRCGVSELVGVAIGKGRGEAVAFVANLEGDHAAGGVDRHISAAFLW